MVIRRGVLSALGAAAGLATWTRSAALAAPASTDDAQARPAQCAFLYCFARYEMARTRERLLNGPQTAGRVHINEFAHRHVLAGPDSRDVTTPNNDTLYSVAWLDLRAGNLKLHVPDTAGRNYSLAFMDMFTNNFAYVGRA